jgi:flagellar FliL protein
MATSAAAAKAPVEAPASAPKKSNLLLIVVLVVALLAAGGAGAWWFLSHSEDDEDAEEIASKPAIFLPLEQFTVNLQPEEGQQFLQTAMTLKVAEQDVVESIKAQMPEVRSRLLFVLSSKKPSELSSVEGKNKLMEEVTREVEAALPPVKTKAKKAKRSEDDARSKKGKSKAKKAKEEADEEEEPAPNRVLAVFFTHFIIQ